MQLLVDKVIHYCLGKKGAALDYPFDRDIPVVKVAGKIFALIFIQNKEHSFVNLKCDPLIAANLREQNKNIRPGYHMNKQHWNTVQLDGSVPEDDLTDMIDHSYEMVVKKLPKHAREALEESGKL
ncbi:MmcQ/YjbR family DNA-binding protein [Paenibacillus sp. CN-4]|uniref:MmcQ/YjbR family DNA-binding protein n=1 Tax=Paenibacillus nanchangensis TaxID=3348343 RepID=UPI00397E62B9